MNKNDFKADTHKDGRLRSRVIMIGAIIVIGIMIMLLPVLYAITRFDWG